MPTPEQAGWLQILADSTAVALESVRRMMELNAIMRNQTPLLRPQPLPKGMVRMCAWTRRLELDGEWMSVEAYLLRKFNLSVTHTISDEGMAMITPEFDAA